MQFMRQTHQISCATRQCDERSAFHRDTRVFAVDRLEVVCKCSVEEDWVSGEIRRCRSARIFFHVQLLAGIAWFECGSFGG